MNWTVENSGFGYTQLLFYDRKTDTVMILMVASEAEIQKKNIFTGNFSGSGSDRVLRGTSD